MIDRVVLFDLDGTLVDQEKAFARAYLQTAVLAAASAPIEQTEFATQLPEVADTVFRRSGMFNSVRQCRFGGRDILWGDTSGDSRSMREIAAAAPSYRATVWRSVLERQGIGDAELARQLDQHFQQTMSSGMEAFPEVKRTLDSLAGRFRLGILTNGMPGAQRGKLRELDIEGHFEHLVASADVGVGKPARQIFEHALRLFQVSAEDAIMVGDSLEGDVLSAARVGMRAIWINRDSAAREGHRSGLPDLRDLTRLLGS